MNKVKILSIKNATHDVMHIKTEKPEGIIFSPGQAVDFALNKPDWKNELRPFTFTSLPEDDYLEFFIKMYADHNGVTKQIKDLKQGDTVFIGDVFGDIAYKGEGVFIAGGAGITPFIAILKDLKKKNLLGNNKLIFANKTSADIVEKEYFVDLLAENFINVLSDEKIDKFEHGFVSKDIIKAQISSENNYFYLCGPPPMMNAVLKMLNDLGIDESKIVFEAF